MRPVTSRTDYLAIGSLARTVGKDMERNPCLLRQCPLVSLLHDRRHGGARDQDLVREQLSSRPRPLRERTIDPRGMTDVPAGRMGKNVVGLVELKRA